MTKHLRLVFGLLVIVSMVALPLIGCAQQPPAATPTTAAPAKAATPAAPAAATPKPAVTPASAAPKPAASVDKITVGMSQEPDTLLQDAGSMYASAVVRNALGTEAQNSGTAALVWRDDKNEIIPGIAESVPTFDNGGAKFVGEGADKHLEVTFKLRKNVKWHDGTQVTSKDVKFEWEVVMNPDFPIADRSQYQKIQTVETPDDYTVIFKFMSQNQAREAAKTGGLLKEPKEYADYKNQEGPVTDALYNRVGAVMPAHLYSKIPVKDLSKSEYARKPVGMGAYKLKDWVAGQSITLEANPDFFLGAPKIKTVIFKIVPDTNAIIAQLQTGELDVVTEDALQLNNIPDYDRVAQAGVVKFYYTPAMVWEHVDMNNDNPILKDVNVRKAIAYAVDRKSIVDKVLYGKTQVINSWITPNHWAYSDAVTKYDYNPEKAKELLKEAGYTPGPDGILVKDGKPLKLKLQTTAQNKLRELTTQIIQQNLKAVGIAIDLDYLPAKNFFATDGKGPLSDGTYELGLYAWVAGDDPGGNDLYLSKNIPTKENSYQGQNYPHWRNAKNDELLIKANAAFSEKERKPLYAEQQKIFSDELPTLPLYQRINIAAAKAKLQNFKPTPTMTPPTWNIQEWVLPAN